MQKTYEPTLIETHWNQTWETKGYYQPHGEKNPYCIMLPPPNVTGSLHMGHGFGYTLIDILIRYHRMLGDRTLWQGGTDHAGIATQLMVERLLKKENKSRQSIGREAFLKKSWEWKEASGGRITQQLRRLGASIDWSREKFTLDEDLSHAVQKVFISLYEEKLIERGQRLVNWDPSLQTAISDLEVINTEEQGYLWHIRYPVVDQEKKYLIVATTRPETLLGDAALAVHPDDVRYQSLIGKRVHVPLTDRTIPIIADTYVDPAFGSGCVKITPAHDFNDYEVGKRHQLPSINIFTPSACLNKNVPENYQGLDRFEARKKIINDLEMRQLMEKIENHLLKIPRNDRGNEIIEPYLTDQWFVKMKNLAEPALMAVKNGDVRFVPENWNKTYFQWLENIDDWCISRQLWWGHRIPAWYDETGNCYVGENEEQIRKRYQLNDGVSLRQDPDVLDTWFSSALWPFSTLGWPDSTKEYDIFYPTSALVTGFDIIFFWVARMIMMGLKFTGKVPFKEVYITGLIRDSKGHKMSKSKGNGLDPLDLIDGIDLESLVKKRCEGVLQQNQIVAIEKATRQEFPTGIAAYGTDALRFTFASLATHGRDVRFDVKRLEGNRNFCNKLWNAARYVLMHTESYLEELNASEKELSLADHWILSRLQHAIKESHQAYQEYRFDLLAKINYEFTWDIFCDWYLELSKPLLFDKKSDPLKLRGTRYTLITVLEQLLRLLHPIMPFITEEIWQRVAPLIKISNKTIMLQPYPRVDETFIQGEVEKEIDWLKNNITAVRTIRSEMNIAPGKLLTVILNNGNSQDRVYFQRNKALLMNLSKLNTIEFFEDNKKLPVQVATAIVGELTILVSLEDLINIEEEVERLKKDIKKYQKEIEAADAKLKNDHFISRAPEEVVEKEKEKRLNAAQAINKLEVQMKKYQSSS